MLGAVPFLVENSVVFGNLTMVYSRGAPPPARRAVSLGPRVPGAWGLIQAWEPGQASTLGRVEPHLAK